MMVNATPVYHGANLTMLMVNLSQILIRSCRDAGPEFSVNDFKTASAAERICLKPYHGYCKCQSLLSLNQALRTIQQTDKTA
jgi:hypothetical protein